MSDWPENLKGLDVNWTWTLLLKTALNWMLPLLLVLGLGLAHATDLPTVVVTDTTDWLRSSAWFSDGAIGGFDAAGAAYAGW